MDELELLKKDWKRQEESLPKLSYDQIYQMILKKSSSIVKWIFRISVIEFLLWLSIDVSFRLNEGYQGIEEKGMEGFSSIAMVISYGILVYFMVQFYRNYKKIETTDSAKVLMQNILKTRRTVRHYVLVNLSFLAIFTISSIVYLMMFTDEFAAKAGEQEVPMLVVIIVTLIAVALLIGFVALFYRLVYGILTRKLKKNYKELEQLEV